MIHSPLERILYYIAGGFVGAIGGMLVMRFQGQQLSSQHITLAYVFSTCIGLIVTMAIIEYIESVATRRNNKIRQEVVVLLTHEVRTALTSTGWAIDMILEKYIDHITAGDAQLLKSIENSIHATVMHSVNLLDISAQDAGKLLISLQWTTLDKVETMFKEIVRKYDLNAQQKEITLTASIALDPHKEAQVDMLRLRIVLENLLENAMQYTVLNEKKITVTVTNDNEKVLITVADTGIGIPDKEKHDIYKEFFRASNARKNLTNGSGIGLYTCMQYIKAHHGTIHFKSKENVGTTFYISIPLRTKADVNEFITKV